MGEVKTGPYREEFGAVFHQDTQGFIFTVKPPEFAADVVSALNDQCRTPSEAVLVEALEWMVDGRAGARNKAKAALAAAKGE